MRGGLPPTEAVAWSLPRLKGAFALAPHFEGDQELIIGARRGAPLAVGFEEGDRAGEIAILWRRECTNNPRSSGALWPIISTCRRARAALPFDVPVDVAKLTRSTISACGTAYIAGLVAKYWFERYARLPVDVEVASARTETRTDRPTTN